MQHSCPVLPMVGTQSGTVLPTVGTVLPTVGIELPTVGTVLPMVGSVQRQGKEAAEAHRDSLYDKNREQYETQSGNENK